MAAGASPNVTAQEKYEARWAAFMSPQNVRFASPEVEKAYKDRVKCVKDAIELKKTDRILVCPWVGYYPARNAGITAREAMYDYQKLNAAWKKYHADFMPDSLATSLIATAGKVFDILDYKLYRWPGHGTPEDAPYQYVEAEYMKDDEYDAFINDPSGYWMRTYIPRVFGALESWSMFAPFTDLVEILSVAPFFLVAGIPPVQKSLEVFVEAGKAALEWMQVVGQTDGEVIGTFGVVPMFGGFTKAPFDTLADTLRTTRSIMVDIYRRPAKLLQALDRLVPIMVDMGVRAGAASGNPLTFIPLHKGADGFLSRENFARFYWPTLKAVMLGLIKEGLTPYVFVEGSYNQRLDFLADPEIPRGKVVWMFDQTDMVKVKEVLGGVACFGGNVPASMLNVGTPEDVRRYVKDLIDKVGRDGGFILSTGGVVDEAKPENLRAMIEAGKEYGARA